MDFFSLFRVLLFAVTVASAKSGFRGLFSLSHGNALSVEEEFDVLISPYGAFSAGFYNVGTNAYCFSIWFTNSLDRTIVWMANRDRPVNGKRSKLTLQRNGDLILTDADGSIAWSTNTFSDANVEARLLETGNLILIDQAGQVVWQSFQFPTDTLLPYQPMVRHTTLISAKSKGTYFSGFYKFKFDDNNILNLIYDGPQVSSIYLPNTKETVFSNLRTPYNSSRSAFLNERGRFISSDDFQFNASDYGTGPNRRLTLDYDGMLRLYTLDVSTGLWEVSWLPGGLDACAVHGLCGPNGICGYNPYRTCTCPQGFEIVDPSDWSKGCSPLFNLTCNPIEQDFIGFKNTDYFGYDMSFYQRGISFEACRSACLNDCRCKGFGYALDGKGECFPKSSLFNGFSTPSSPSIMHIKVPKEMAKSQAERAKSNELNCSMDEILLTSNHSDVQNRNKNLYMRYLIGFASLVGVTEIMVVGLGWWYVFRKHTQEELLEMGYIVLAMGFKRFTFTELKKATRNFKQEIGKGGFGTVYKGVLDNNRIVAVKRLEGVVQGETEFWAEVSILGKLNHKNLAKMWGFCTEGEHKLLVYDYMENGSLDKFLFSSSSSKTLEFDQRYNIALGTAKGLAYIHEECLEWVLHCDVKPQNILLDDNLEPKLTDFGMAKLFRDNYDPGFSRVHGTRGYLAPEWMANLNINAKADVYSYGVVLLELLCGKSASGFWLCGGAKENNPLVQWFGRTVKVDGIEGVIDSELTHDCDHEKIERLVEVALMCVREDRDKRPAMSKVVELLTKYGDSDLNEEIKN